jgi:hypothetical protein
MNLILYSIVPFISLIILNIFDIIGLLNDNLIKTKYLCNDSHIWHYVLISLIIINLFLLSIKCIDKDDVKKLNYVLLFSAIYFPVMIIWGIVELFGILCINNLYNTLIYDMMVINWITYIFIFSIFFIKFIYYLSL